MDRRRLLGTYRPSSGPVRRRHGYSDLRDQAPGDDVRVPEQHVQRMGPVDALCRYMKRNFRNLTVNKVV